MKKRTYYTLRNVFLHLQWCAYVNLLRVTCCTYFYNCSRCPPSLALSGQWTARKIRIDRVSCERLARHHISHIDWRVALTAIMAPPYRTSPFTQGRLDRDARTLTTRNTPPVCTYPPRREDALLRCCAKHPRGSPKLYSNRYKSRQVHWRPIWSIICEYKFHSLDSSCR